MTATYIIIPAVGGYYFVKKAFKWPVDEKVEKSALPFFIQQSGRETFVFLLLGLTGTQLQAICGISKDTIN